MSDHQHLPAPASAVPQRRVITDRAVQALKPAQPGKRYVVWDAIVPGFGVRVTDKGHCTFIVMRRRRGEPHPVRHAIGDVALIALKDAREAARVALHELATGTHPTEKRREVKRREAARGRDTFEAVANEFIARHVAKLRSAQPIAATIHRHLVPRWRTRPITSITRRDVVALLEETVDAGTIYMAHHLLAYTRKLFNWAIARDLYGLQTSPCDRISPRDVIGARPPRQRVLSDPEIRLVWRAAEWATDSPYDKFGYPFTPLIRLLLLTGQRLREVANAQWNEIDFDQAMWTIPHHRMKGDAAHQVPLAPVAAGIFQSLPRFTGPYVFTTLDGTRPISGFGKVKHRIDATIRKLASETGGIDPTIEGWRFHDLRRTMRTQLSGLPVPEIVRELVIAHKQPGLHRVYDQHAYRDEKRNALELWEQKLMSIVTPKTSDNVLPLIAKR